MKKVNVGSDQSSYDYIVFDTPELDFNDLYQFDMGDHNNIKEGEQIIIMGFPFGTKNLTSHVGYVSSKYLKNDVNYIKLDASINAGNSGGPLIDIKSTKVVGIITRALTGLDENFNELQEIFWKNKELIKRSSTSCTIFTAGINLINSLEDTQEKIEILVKNIHRTANVGIGIAFSCNNLKKGHCP